MSVVIRKDQNRTETNTLDGASKGETVVTISMVVTSNYEQEYTDIFADDEPLTPEQEAKIVKALKDLEDGSLEDYEPL